MENEDYLNKCLYKSNFSPSIFMSNIMFGINKELDYEDALKMYITESVDLCKAKIGNNFY